MTQPANALALRFDTPELMALKERLLGSSHEKKTPASSILSGLDLTKIDLSGIRLPGIGAALASPVQTALAASREFLKIIDPSLSQMVRYTSELGARLLGMDPPKKSALCCPIGVVQILTMLLCGMTNPKDQIKVLAEMKLATMSSEEAKEEKKESLTPAASNLALVPGAKPAQQTVVPEKFTPTEAAAIDALTLKVAVAQKKLMDKIVVKPSPDPTLPVVSSGVAMGISKPLPQVSPGGPLDPDYLSTYIRGLKEVLKGEVFLTEDIDPLKKWVLDQIHDAEMKANMSRMIDESLAQDWKAASAALIHVFYFQATWEQQFDPQRTFFGDVICADGSWVKCKVMAQEFENMNVHIGENYTLFEIPYKVDKEGEATLSYVGIIPHNQAEIDAIIPQVPNIIQNGFPAALPRRTIVQLPKQMLDRKIDLIPPLERMGYPMKAFLDRIGPLKQVGAAKQVLTGKLDEKGMKLAVMTYATTCTMAVAGSKINLPPLFLDVRRPYIGCLVASIPDGGETTLHLPLAMVKVCDKQFLVEVQPAPPRPKIDYQVLPISARDIKGGYLDLVPAFEELKQNAVVKKVLGNKEPVSAHTHNGEGNSIFTVVNYTTDRDVSFCMRNRILLNKRAVMVKAKQEGRSELVLQNFPVPPNATTFLVFAQGERTLMFAKEESSRDILLYQLDYDGNSSVEILGHQALRPI